MEPSSTNRIDRYDMWPSLIAALYDQKELVFRETQRVFMSSGKVIMAYDTLSSTLYFAKHEPNEHTRLTRLDRLSGQNLRWFAYINFAIFTITTNDDLWCWSPLLQTNPLLSDVDYDESRRANPYVRPFVYKVAHGRSHILLLADQEDPKPEELFSKRLIIVYSWSEQNLLNRVAMRRAPTALNVEFPSTILDIACTKMNGSVVLDSQNNYHVWGSINGRMFNYVPIVTTFNLENHGRMVRVFATSRAIIFLSNQGRVFYTNYELDYFTPIIEHSIELFEMVKNVYSDYEKRMCLLAGVSDRLYLWDYPRPPSSTPVPPLILLDQTFIPDAYCLYVTQATPEPTTLVYSDEKFRDFTLKCGTFNDLRYSCTTITLINHMKLFIHKKHLIEQIVAESEYFENTFRNLGEDVDAFMQSLSRFIRKFETCVSYTYLYYLYTKEVIIDSEFLGQLSGMCKESKCRTMPQAIERRKIINDWNKRFEALCKGKGLWQQKKQTEPKQPKTDVIKIQEIWGPPQEEKKTPFDV